MVTIFNVLHLSVFLRIPGSVILVHRPGADELDFQLLGCPRKEGAIPSKPIVVYVFDLLHQQPGLVRARRQWDWGYLSALVLY